jgi:uncharacterized protein YycO
VPLPPVMLEAFANELEKIGAAKAIDDPKELEKILKPGDILYTRPKNIDKLTHKAFYALESSIQGSPYTHVGLYVGDGKIVDAGSWRKGQGDSTMKVHEVPLSKFTDRYSFKVLRVAASSAKKRDAVAYAKKQVGKEFNLKGMFRLILPFKGQADNRDRKDAAESFFCSELVANSYNGVNIAKERHLHHVMPGDIAKSPLTKTVAEYK